MNNLEKIKMAWSMGWSAVLGEFPIIAIWEDGSVTTVCKENDRTYNFSKTALEKHCRITGYLYAGELAGNERPQVGQKFRIKGNLGLIVKFQDSEGKRYQCGRQLYDKSEIEPVFD
jgi:hypothetical protein